eukprot:108858-Prorocentrum_minimum.AAC.1
MRKTPREYIPLQAGAEGLLQVLAVVHSVLTDSSVPLSLSIYSSIPSSILLSKNRGILQNLNSIGARNRWFLPGFQDSGDRAVPLVAGSYRLFCGGPRDGSGRVCEVPSVAGQWTTAREPALAKAARGMENQHRDSGTA